MRDGGDLIWFDIAVDWIMIFFKLREELAADRLQRDRVRADRVDCTVEYPSDQWEEPDGALLWEHRHRARPLPNRPSPHFPVLVSHRALLCSPFFFPLSLPPLPDIEHMFLYRRLFLTSCRLIRGEKKDWWGLWLRWNRLWMITWHLGLFLCLTFGQIGFKGRTDDYFWRSFCTSFKTLIPLCFTDLYYHPFEHVMSQPLNYLSSISQFGPLVLLSLSLDWELYGSKGETETERERERGVVTFTSNGEENSQTSHQKSSSCKLSVKFAYRSTIEAKRGEILWWMIGPGTP